VDVYLIRHAVAHRRDPDRWPDDALRPLTPEGEEEFRAVARELGRLAPEVGALLSSPYARAWQTAELLQEVGGWPEPKPFPVLKPEVPPSAAASALSDYAGAGAVALVGHRPGLHELAAYLLTGDTSADIRIKKGGALRLTFEGAPLAGEGSLRWLTTPRLLRPA
jgi:phosphohistidine phosphatase